MVTRLIKMILLLLVFATAAGISTYATIHLLIRSEDTVVVPDLLGREIVFALELLTDLQLNTKVKGSAFDAVIPKHHVVSQDPEPGREIKKGRDIRLILSRGPHTVVLPNLTGLAAPQARILLEENGLRQGHISRVHHATRPREEILAQDPAAGSFSVRGDGVNLLISDGPAQMIVKMLDLKGLELGQAAAALEKIGLSAGSTRIVQAPSISPGTVVDHDPDAGYPVPIGSSVDLAVTQGKNGSNYTAHAPRLYRYRSGPGFLRESVRVCINRPAVSIDFFNAFIKPNEQIWLLIPQDEHGTLLLYVDDELVTTENFQ